MVSAFEVVIYYILYTFINLFYIVFETILQVRNSATKKHGYALFKRFLFLVHVLQNIQIKSNGIKNTNRPTFYTNQSASVNC